MNLPDPVVQLVSELLSLMIFLLAMSASLTLLLLIYNRIYQRYRQGKHRIFTREIVSFLLTPEEPLPPFSISAKSIYRDAIIDILLVTKGTEKQLLSSLYYQKGFWKDDLDDLKNRRWFQRLSALARIDIWKTCLPPELIKPLLEDENIHVRHLALKNLSRSEDSEDAKLLLGYLSQVENSKNGLCYEILHRLSSKHYPLLRDTLLNDPHHSFAPVILKIFGDLLLHESVPVLMLFTGEDHHEDVRASALQSLGKLEDPRGLPILRKSLHSSSSKIRLAALQALAVLDERVIHQERSFLVSDPDPLMSAWASHFLKEQH